MTETVATHDAVQEAEQAVRDARRQLRRVASELRVEYKVVGHIISTSVDHGTYTGRLVLEDPEGFFQAVLAVGDPQRDPHLAIDDAADKYGRAALAAVQARGSASNGE